MNCKREESRADWEQLVVKTKVVEPIVHFVGSFLVWGVLFAVLLEFVEEHLFKAVQGKPLFAPKPTHLRRLKILQEVRDKSLVGQVVDPNAVAKSFELSIPQDFVHEHVKFIENVFYRQLKDRMEVWLSLVHFNKLKALLLREIRAGQ